MGEVFIRKCAMCGEPMEYTYATKALKYCPACQVEHRRQKQREKNARHKEKLMLEAKADRIAHQQDTSIWTHDYAERQKQRTLAMVGGITLWAGGTYSAGHNENETVVVE